ncbi:WD repeat-containing protein 44-like [Oryza brachyantha]|uniref:WD repeat-containing protein 44-like n=1 Tax=Oryza brachyantha TaxID=4533 RepID=UPI001ADA87ED|nr:WD repeat-containing protein 44-like [Oryza brachyantha]
MSGAEEEEEEEEEEVFYEARDRVLSSSSCSSTSASDDDDHPRRGRDAAAAAAAAAAALDVWTSEPAPVQERRRRLLQMMGLSGDPSLARLEMGRSVSYDGPIRPETVSPISRSRSDGAVPASATKPPLAVRSRHTSSDSSEATPEGADADPRCLIRNLDDGSEFVVKEEFALREVGTGRRLTIEEFDLCVGRSPIVQELMRRQNVANSGSNNGASALIQRSSSDSSNSATRHRRRSNWLRSIRNVAGSMVVGSRDRRSSDEKDTSSEKGGRRSSSATDDSQDSVSAARHCPERVKVRQYGKSCKELNGLFMNQEIQAHNGSIWSIKFSPDGRYLATAGEDCVIHVWEVSEFETKREDNELCNQLMAVVCNGSPEPILALASVDGSCWEKKHRARTLESRKSANSDRLMFPEHVFALSEKPVKTFEGHSEDVLDLCWSKSQHLLSSSMDKTVRLWHMSSTSCLKTFSHSDYVTCIQFNPVDDNYFISGSLDEKVRIWSIPRREIVDWNDLHEMVTAACYTPDGQRALIGSHKGSCHIYDTSDNKLLQKKQIDLQNKKKKSSQKKITGFQFLPGSSSKVLITSADSRIRVVDGFELVHKFKGFRNTNSQISACLAANGRYVISASEDSHVYFWRNDDNSAQGRSKTVVSTTNSYEYFHCQDVTVAVALPSSGSATTSRNNSRKKEELDSVSEYPQVNTLPEKLQDSSDFHRLSGNALSTSSNHSGDRTSATWPEELMTPSKQSPRSSSSLPNGAGQAPSRSAWGLVFVTAGRGGQIRTFQNFGFPVRV